MKRRAEEVIKVFGEEISRLEKIPKIEQTRTDRFMISICRQSTQTAKFILTGEWGN